MKKTWAVLPLIASCLATAPAAAATVLWTDWTAATPSTQVTGSIAAGSTIGVTASGSYSFVQLSGGTNYWAPSAPYISGSVSNAPPGTDIIALNAGGTETVTFSAPVVDPLVALVSWNGNTVKFNAPIEIVSFGAGFWGNGTPVLNATGDGFIGSGEVHGVVRLLGTFSSFSFTHTSENWHGFTVGITSEATQPIPEPSALWLLVAGLPVVWLRRRAQGGEAAAR